VSDLVTTMTDLHVDVIRALERMGVGLMYEVPFPPYTVDIYVPNAHAAVEVDGPQHSNKRDRERDDWLTGTYNLCVYHVTQRGWKTVAGREYYRKHLWEFITDARADAEERFNEVRDRVPWL